MRSVSLSLLILLALAALAGSLDAQTYDLRGPAPEQGTIVQTRTEWKRPKGTLTIEENGEVIRASSSYEALSITEMEAVQTIGQKLSMLRSTVAEDWLKSSFKRDGFPLQTTIEDGPFVGETLLIERRGDGWHKTMLGQEPNEKQKARLRKPFVEDTERYPARPVAVGETWVLEGEKLARLQGFEDALSAGGKATFTLDRVIEEGGDRLALISYRLELKVRMLDDNQVPFDHSLGGSGQIKRSLKAYVNLSDRFLGQTFYAVTVTENGRKSNRTNAGPVEVFESQRLVTPSSRAAVVRRAQTQAVQERALPTPVAPNPAVGAKASCKGTSLACSQRSEFNCGFGSGCFASGLCSGVPSQTCFAKPQLSCTSTPGCYWQSWSKTCGGVQTCAGKVSFACKSTSGCRWQSMCTGNAKPCSELKQALCSMQPGCQWR